MRHILRFAFLLLTFALLLFFINPVSAGAINLPQTDQTTCYDTVEANIP